MIHHISISAREPQRVAEVLAELWQGRSMPFPPFPGAYIAYARDRHGTAIEVLPLGGELVPGVEGQEVQATHNEDASPYTPTHAALSVPLSEERVKEIAAREGWRAETFERGTAFSVVEFWIENRLLVELLPPPMQSRYLENMTPEYFADMFGLELETQEEELELAGASA